MKYTVSTECGMCDYEADTVEDALAMYGAEGEVP